MGVFSNKISRDALKPGDHIYSWRNAYIYSHHGIYAGEGKVIHFTRGPGQEIGTGTVLDNVNFSSSAPSDGSKCQCAVCGDQSNLSGVISSCLDSFLWGGGLYLFEYGVSPAFFLSKVRGGTCTLAKSDPPEDALFRALHLLAYGFGDYNIFKNNCEDFAIYCKTGLLVVADISVGRSGQATTFVAGLDVAVTAALTFLFPSFRVLTTVGCGRYFVNRFVCDIGMRHDVRKIPVEELLDRTNLSQSIETAIARPTETAMAKPTETAIAQPTETVVVKSTEAAIAKQTEAAIAKPIETAVAKPMETAIAKQIETTIAKPTKTAIAQPTETPIAKPAEIAVAEPMETAIAKQTEAAIAKPVETAVAKPMETAIAKPIETAVAKPMETAIAQPTETPIAKPAEVAVVEPMETAIAKQTEAAIAKPVETAVAKPMETAIAKPNETAIAKQMCLS